MVIRRTIPPSPSDWLYDPTASTATTSVSLTIAMALAMTVIETHIETGLLEITCRIKHAQIAIATATRRIDRCIVHVPGLFDHHAAAGASGTL